MDAESVPIAESGTLTIPNIVWDRTKSISAAIAPLASQTIIGRAAVDGVAASLGISRRQVYVLIKRNRDGSGLLTDLAPGRSSGGKGTSRLSDEVEGLVRDLRKQFLTRQKRTLAAVHRDIAAACRARGLPAPSRNKVERRILALNPVEVGRRRGGQDAVWSLQAAEDRLNPPPQRLRADAIGDSDLLARLGRRSDLLAQLVCSAPAFRPICWAAAFCRRS